MRKVVLCLLCGLALRISASAAPPSDLWPTVQDQLSRDEVVPGSPLEMLVRDNQELGMLRPEELHDKIPVPLWLRVWWRKGHPDGSYSSSDPTGGYPHVLKEIHEWMVTHQDLAPGLPKVAYGASLDVLTEAATAGLNLRISGSHSAPRSESDIRVNYWDPQKILSASNNIGGTGRQGQYWSTNGGSTWGQTELPLAAGDSYHSDPTVDWTSDGTAWSTTIGINSGLRMQAYKSTNNGATWTWDATFSGAQTAADKQMMWVDHSGASPYADNIYVCWHNNTPQFVNRRTSSGWGTPLQISGSETAGTAIGCDVKTNANGDVFVFWPSTNNRRILVAKSTNGGASYTAPVIITTAYDGYDIGVPAFRIRRALVYVSGGAYRTASRNLVYASWTDLSGETGCTAAANEPGSNVASTCKTRIWFARSTDGGATWGTPQKINPASALSDQFNQAMAVDETTGRISIVYYDTVADAGRKKTHLYYQSSADDGISWSSPLLVTTAQTDETNAGSDSGNQYGDYNSLTGNDGSFWPSWTDRRGNAREEIWTANLVEPCTPPPYFVAGVAASGTQVNLWWPAVPGAASYDVLRSTASGGPYTFVGSTANPWLNDASAVCSTTYYYVIHSAAGCPSVNSAEATVATRACGAPAPATNLDFHTVAPCRLIDTRLSVGPLGGPSLAPSAQRSFGLAGACGIPSTAGALAVNVTAIGATANGNLTIFPADQSAPATSTINFTAGANRANNAIIKLSPTGVVSVKANTLGAVDFTLDVVGYFQ